MERFAAPCGDGLLAGTSGARRAVAARRRAAGMVDTRHYLNDFCGNTAAVSATGNGPSNAARDMPPRSYSCRAVTSGSWSPSGGCRAATCKTGARAAPSNTAAGWIMRLDHPHRQARGTVLLDRDTNRHRSIGHCIDGRIGGEYETPTVPAAFSFFRSQRSNQSSLTGIFALAQAHSGARR